MSQALGRYELLRPLGRGGMAEVFHARRRGPGGIEKRLVVKRIRRERSTDPRFVQLFVQEARLSMSLAHKNIVPVFDFGRVGDELFLVMEYVDGPDLAAAVERGKEAGNPMDPELAAFVALEACQALDYAHRARDEAGTPRAIVHRDVTTRNVIVSSSGEVKLVDFGVATSETDLGARKVRGTPAYMSPEQARGDSVDPRSDVFSLGLVLYELVSGERAYAGPRNAELLEQARRAEVPTLPDSVADELRAIVARATAAEADDRFEDARAMQLALDSFLVKARAKSGGPPPSVRLAGWIEAIWTERDRSGVRTTGGDASTRAPTGPVVTFLDDGEQALTSLAAGEQTLESMAATLGESVAGVDAAGGERDSDDRADSDDRTAGDASVNLAVNASAGRDDVSSPPADATKRRAAWFPWSVGAVVAVLAAIGIAAIVDSDAAAPDVVRPAVERSAASPATAGSPEPGSVGAAGKTDEANEGGQDVAATPVNDDPGAVAATDSTDAPSTGTSRTATRGPSAPSTKASSDKPADAGDKASHEAPGPSASAKHGALSESEGEKAMGTAVIAVRPWARVAVIGRDETCPETPCRLELPVGRYSLRLEHTVWNVAKTIEVEIRADQATQVSEVLLQPR